MLRCLPWLKMFSYEELMNGFYWEMSWIFHFLKPLFLNICINIVFEKPQMKHVCIVFLITCKWPFGFAACHFFGFFSFFFKSAWFPCFSRLPRPSTVLSAVVKLNVCKRFFKVKPTFVSIVVIVTLAASGAGLSLILGWASNFVRYGKVLHVFHPVSNYCMAKKKLILVFLVL